MAIWNAIVSFLQGSYGPWVLIAVIVASAFLVSRDGVDSPNRRRISS